MFILGITGTLGAGKGTIVDHLVKKKGFRHFSVRGFITEEIKRRGLEVNRDNMVKVGNDLRSKHHPGWIVEQLYEQAKATGQDCVIESIRAVGEVETLQKKGLFRLLAVNAEPRTRYSRIKKRASETDSVSYETFLENELREMTSTDPSAQNISRVMLMADAIIRNDGTVAELRKKTDTAMKLMLKKKSREFRPSWDDYFMEIADAISKRATCDRGRSGCVIARDKQVLVSGYVGSPRGLPHCDDVGHQMKKTIHEDGSITQHCVRTVHAEQNAICQAAKRGVAIDGATLYCRMTPCRVCAMLIINCGIVRVVCERKYHAGAESEQMLRKAGIRLEYKHLEVQQYRNQ